MIEPQQEVGPAESSAEDQSIGTETNSIAETEPPATDTARREDSDPTANSSPVESEQPAMASPRVLPEPVTATLPTTPSVMVPCSRYPQRSRRPVDRYEPTLSIMDTSAKDGLISS